MLTYDCMLVTNRNKFNYYLYYQNECHSNCTDKINCLEKQNIMVIDSYINRCLETNSSYNYIYTFIHNNMHKICFITG